MRVDGFHFALQPPVHYERPERQQGCDKQFHTPTQRPAEHLHGVGQRSTIKKKQATMNHTGDRYRQRFAGHVLERHGNAQQEDERDAFTSADGAKPLENRAFQGARTLPESCCKSDSGIVIAPYSLSLAA